MLKSKVISRMLYVVSWMVAIFFFTTYDLPLTTCRAQDEYVYDSRGKRNPFLPLITSDGRLLKLDKEEGVKGLVIEGIIYDKHGLSYAIVNGDVVQIGDKVGGYQVLKIESDKVVFIKDAKSLEVELKKEEE